jgi:hypothetical protein
MIDWYRSPRVGLAMARKTITRADLCEAVYQKVGLSRTESATLVQLVLKEITDCLERGRFPHDLRSPLQSIVGMEAASSMEAEPVSPGQNVWTAISAAVMPARSDSLDSYFSDNSNGDQSPSSGSMSVRVLFRTC